MDRILTPLLGRILGWFFRHLYTDLGWSYDLIAWLVSFGQWGTWRNCGLASLPPGKVLEVGHGPGHALVDLARKGRSPVGLDLSPQMGRQAAKRLRRMGLPARLVRARVQALPFPAHSLDGVLSTFPSEYVFDLQALSELHRVLPDGGTLVIVLVAHISAGRTVDRVIDWFFRASGFTKDVIGSLTGRLEASGFSAVPERIGLPHSIVYRLACCRIDPGRPAGQALQSPQGAPWRRD